MGCCSSHEKALIQSLQAQKTTLESQNKELVTQFKSLSQEPSELFRLKQEIQDLSEQLVKEKNLKTSWVFKSLSRHYKKTLNSSLGFSFMLWKNWIRMIEKSESFLFDLKDTAYDSESLSLAEDFIQKDRKSLLSGSPVWDFYLKNQDNSVSQMPIQKLLKFFEDMLELKSVQDQRDLQEKRRPKGIPDFFIDFLNRSFGLKHLAAKSLNQMIPALLSGSGFFHVFLCKILQISNPEPVSYSISLFLTKIRTTFNSVLTKSGKNLIKSANSSKNEGGNLHLADLLAMIYSLFEKNRPARNLLIKELRPADVSQEAFLLFHIWFKLARLQMTADDLFDSLNLKQAKALTTKFIVNGICRILDLALDQESADVFVKLLDEKQVGKVTKEAFVRRLSQKNFAKDAEKLFVNKFRFLECTLKVCNEFRVKSIAFFLFRLKEIDEENYDLSVFKEFLKAVDAGLSQEAVESIFEEICLIGVNKFSIAKVLTEYGVGDTGMKSFGICYLVVEGLTQAFEKRRSEIIEEFLEGCKSSAKLIN